MSAEWRVEVEEEGGERQRSEITNRYVNRKFHVEVNLRLHTVGST